MPQRQTKFSETWLSSVDSNGQRIGEWCRKGQNEYQAYCQFCDVQVKCDNAGKTQLLQHSKQKKHIDAIKHSVDKKQKKLVAFSKQSGESSACSSQSLGLITPGNSMNAEIFLLAKMSVSNLSLRSVDNIGDLFRAMFPDSKIAANFKLSGTSASYMIADGMSKYFTQLIVKDLVNDVIPVFEQFLLLFQRASPVIHIMYDSMCDILVRLLRRFMKGQAVEKRYGSDLTSIECQDVKLQLPDKSIVIGKGAREALVKLTSEQQRQALLGICSFMCTTATELQQKLPLKNELLRQLGCTNPLKWKKESTVSSIERLTTVLQPAISTSEVIDEWKFFQVDNELPDYNQQERIEKYWNAVFQLQSSDRQLRYKLLPAVIKSALTLGQTNAESECSLSVNAAIVTRERTLLSENTIIGLHVVKEAVRFFDPVSNQPEKIAITDDLRRFVRNAHAAYKERLEREREDEEKKRQEVQRMKEISEKAKKEKERLLEKKKSLELTEDNLNEQEEKARQKLSVADELLKDATSKLDSALASKPINTNSITAAKMMLETASVKREEAMDELDEIRKRRKSLDKSTHKLLDQALPSKETLKAKENLKVKRSLRRN